MNPHRVAAREASPQESIFRAVAFRIWSGLALGVALSCSPPAEDRHFANEGEVCVFPERLEIQPDPHVDRTPRMYEAGVPLAVVVTFPTCMSVSCSKNIMAACTVSDSEPGTLTVTSHGSYRHEGSSCTKDCRRLRARCETPPLVPGSYRLRHGSDQVAITVPSTAPIPCVGMTWKP